MALVLADSVTTHVRNAISPLAPVTDPSTGEPATITVAGITLAVVSRGAGPETYQLARFRDAKPASADYAPAVAKSSAGPAVKQVGTPGREAGYLATSRIADIARAISGGLLA